MFAGPETEYLCLPTVALGASGTAEQSQRREQARPDDTGVAGPPSGPFDGIRHIEQLLGPRPEFIG
jgi:hypothetical protein